MHIMWNIDKGMMLTASRRIDKIPTPGAEVFWQIPHRWDRQDDKYPTHATTTTIL